MGSFAGTTSGSRHDRGFCNEMSTQFGRLKERLLERVSGQIRLYGFSRRPRFQEFSKKTYFGRQGFHLSFIRHKLDFDVAADVGIRFDAVEDLVNKTKPFLSDTEKRNTYTLGADLGNLTGEGDKRWTVTKLLDVEPVSESIMDSFRSVAIPYFQRYSDSERVLQTLSSPAISDTIHSPIPGERAMQVIALAFLLGDRKRFLAISSAETRSLTARNDPALPRFLELRDHLKHQLNK